MRRSDAAGDAIDRSRVVPFMFDGKEWNVWNSSADGARIIRTRIAGWRHGLVRKSW